MPQKSIEQYERELMEMYRMALAKDPNYAALAREHSAVPTRDKVSEEEKIDVAIPAPGVEEAVPLPPRIVPIAQEEPAEPEESVGPVTPAIPGRPAGFTAPAMPDTSADSTAPAQAEEPPASPMMPTAFPAFETAVMAESGVAPPEAILTSELAEPPAVAVVLPISESAPQPEMRTPTQIEAIVEAETDTETETMTDADTATPIMAEEESISGTGPTVEAPAAPQVPLGTGRVSTPGTPAQPRSMTGTPNIGAGNLIVNVTTQNRTRPVTGATVTVSHPDASGNKVVAKVETDSSGKTELIRLPAPIREIPTYPQPMTGGDMSAKYFVSVEAPDFVGVSDEEVSIFDGVTSVKRIDLMSDSGVMGMMNDDMADGFSAPDSRD